MSVVRAGLVPALLCLLSPAPSDAGVVRGQLTIPTERSDAQSDGLWRIDNGILPVLPRVIDPHSECLIVLLPRVEPKAREPRREDNVTVELRGLRLTQAAIAVPLGAQLDLKNEDRVPHTLYTAAPDETVLPMRPTPAGGLRSERMQRPGTFLLLDDELPHLHGWIVVPERGTTLRPDDHGVFSGTVPDGRYKLKVFFRGAYVLERDVDVGARPVELQLSVARNVARKESAETPSPPVRPLTAAPEAGSPR